MDQYHEPMLTMHLAYLLAWSLAAKLTQSQNPRDSAAGCFLSLASLRLWNVAVKTVGKAIEAGAWRGFLGNSLSVPCTASNESLSL